MLSRNHFATSASSFIRLILGILVVLIIGINGNALNDGPNQGPIKSPQVGEPVADANQSNISRKLIEEVNADNISKYL